MSAAQDGRRLNGKQNALEIIHFGEPERMMMGPPCHHLAYHGCNHEGYQGGGHHLPVGSSWVDIWGTRWQLEHPGVMGFPRGNPLADLPQTLSSYTWPDPQDERISGLIYRQAEGWVPGERFLAGAHRDTLWEKAYMLVGMENLMCYFYSEPQAVRELLHRIMDFQLGIASHYLALGVEMVFSGDDLGTQRGLLLSPQIVHEFLVPEYRRLYDLYRSRGVLINFHSCGHIEPLLETFIELGINILNPLQASANDLAGVRAATAGRMALMGGVSSDLVLRGPIPAIQQEAQRCTELLGRSGGYFCAPDQGLPWPEEHYSALREVVEGYKYPIMA